MKAIIKLVRVEELSRGVSNAILNVRLKDLALDQKLNFNVSSTGMSLRLVSEVAIWELHAISQWLQEDSNDGSNLRDNDAELRMLAKKFIKMTLELENETTI